MLHQLLCWCIRGKAYVLLSFFDCHHFLALLPLGCQVIWLSNCTILSPNLKKQQLSKQQWLPPIANLSHPVEQVVHFNFKIIIKCLYNMRLFEFCSIQLTCWIAEVYYVLMQCMVFERSLLKLSFESVWSSLLFLFLQNNYEELNHNWAHQFTLSHLIVTLSSCSRDFICYLIDWRLRLR